MKRANGTGCIRKLSGNRRKPFAVYVTTRMENGTQTQQYLGTFANRVDAEVFLNEYEGFVCDDINATLDQIYTKWIKEKDGLSKTTLGTYNSAWKWMSDIKDMKIRTVKPADLQAVINKAVKAGRGRDTCENIRIVSHGLFFYAMREGICHKDQSIFLKLPAANDVHKNIFTDIEIEKLKNKKDDLWAQSVLVMLYTGMRVSEMLGLTKFNIDLKTQSITGAGIKTDAGKERTIPIHKEIVPIFEKLVKKRRTYLFSNLKNGQLDRNNYRNRFFNPLMKELQMEHTAHECRHTTASLLVRSGIKPELAKYILGHTQYTTTMDIYNHPQHNDLLKAINEI